MFQFAGLKFKLSNSGITDEEGGGEAAIFEVKLLALGIFLIFLNSRLMGPPETIYALL